MTPEEELNGCWSRSLLVRADGTRDTTTVVTWLQAGTAYVDLRQPAPHPTSAPLAALDRDALLALLDQEAFAGRLDVQGDVAEWHRHVDLGPPTPLGDVGRLRCEGEVLVEDGVHEPYVEHWERPGERVAGSSLRLADGATTALLVRAGTAFGWARGRAAPATGDLRALVADGPLEQARGLVDVEVSLGTVDGAAWVVERSSLPHCVGRDLAPVLDGSALQTDDLTAAGRTTRRTWSVLAAEGRVLDQEVRA